MMGNMGGMMKKVQEMQAKMQEMQKELENKTKPELYHWSYFKNFVKNKKNLC